MRLRIEATPDELADKSEVLVRALAEVLIPVAPDLAEQLEKAIPKDVPKLLQPALREIHELTRREYEKRLKWMLKDIGEVLDRAVLKKAEGDEPPEPGEEKEELEPGDVNPETGEEVPEEEEPEPEGEEPEEEE